MLTNRAKAVAKIKVDEAQVVETQVNNNHAYDVLSREPAENKTSPDLIVVTTTSPCQYFPTSLSLHKQFFRAVTY